MYTNLNPKHIGLTEFMKPEWKYDFLEILCSCVTDGARHYRFGHGHPYAE